MAQNPEATKPLTKAQLDKAQSELGTLAAKVLTLIDTLNTEGMPPKLSQSVRYQIGMVRYATKQMDELRGSLTQAAKGRSRSPKAEATKGKS